MYQCVIMLSDKKELTPSGVCVLNKLNKKILPGSVENKFVQTAKKHIIYPYKPIRL